MVDIPKSRGCEVRDHRSVLPERCAQARNSLLTNCEEKAWRSAHSCVMSHRIFSRNVSSSRAVPVARLMRRGTEQPGGSDPRWSLNPEGMQSHDIKKIADTAETEALWKEAAEKAAAMAERMMALGLRKQVVNGILEPFTAISAVITATGGARLCVCAARPTGDAQPNLRPGAQ